MKPLLLLFLVAPFLLAACAEETHAPPPVPPPSTFSLKTMSELAIHPERSAPAAVIGKHEARISAEVSASIVALPVDVGDRVRRGAVIARLDPRDAELALERAEAALAQAAARKAQAQAQTERARVLREKNFISAEGLTLRETELAAAAADVRAATAQRDTARRLLGKHVLTAPFDAVVRERSGQLGELAAPGAVLLTLVSDGDVELSAQIQPHDAQALAVLPAPTFSFAGRAYDLKLLRVSPTVHRGSRSIEVRFAFVSEAPPTGAEGRLVWRDPQAHLSATFVVRRGDQLGVFVDVGGQARFHPLPGATEGRPAPANLSADARIVVQGQHALQDGTPLKPGGDGP